MTVRDFPLRWGNFLGLQLPPVVARWVTSLLVRQDITRQDSAFRITGSLDSLGPDSWWYPALVQSYPAAKFLSCIRQPAMMTCPSRLSNSPEPVPARCMKLRWIGSQSRSWCPQPVVFWTSRQAPHPPYKWFLCYQIIISHKRYV